MASDSVLKRDTEKQEREKSDEPDQQPLITHKEDEEEDREKTEESVSEGGKANAMPLLVKEGEGEDRVVKSRLQTEAVSTEHGNSSDRDQGPVGGEKPTQQVKEGQSPEDCLTPTTESSVGSSSPTHSNRTPPNSVLRTDSMNSDALLLPREVWEIGMPYH